MSKAIKPRADKNHSAEEDPGLDLFSRVHQTPCSARCIGTAGLWALADRGACGTWIPGQPGDALSVLHSLEKSELLKSHNQLYEGKIRRYYRITANGRRQLKKARHQPKELISEIGLATD